MDFEYSDEQRMLKDSIDRLIGPAYDDLGKRRATQAQGPGFSEELWSKYAELGLTALPFSEEDGGFGGGPVETMVVMEAIGRGLALEPYLASIVIGGNLLRLGGTPEQREACIPHIADGSLRVAFAHVERQARYDLFDVATHAKKNRPRLHDRGRQVRGAVRRQRAEADRQRTHVVGQPARPPRHHAVPGGCEYARYLEA